MQKKTENSGKWWSSARGEPGEWGGVAPCLRPAHLTTLNSPLTMTLSTAPQQRQRQAPEGAKVRALQAPMVVLKSITAEMEEIKYRQYHTWKMEKKNCLIELNDCVDGGLCLRRLVTHTMTEMFASDVTVQMVVRESARCNHTDHA